MILPKSLEGKRKKLGRGINDSRVEANGNQMWML
jgi:hypothetical protein